MPTNEEPVRIKCGPIKWNGTAFELSLAAEFVPPRTSTPQTFSVSTALTIKQARRIAFVNASAHPVEPRPGATLDADGFLPLVPQLVPWDRDGGTLTGLVSALAKTSLHDPAGQVIDRDEYTEGGLDIGGSSIR